MLSAEIRSIDVSTRALRSFGRVVGGVFILIAGVVFWRHAWSAGAAEYWLGGIGATLVVLGLVAPVVLKPIYYVWMSAALVLGFVMTRVLLTLVFYGVMTPIGLIRRMLGHDSMNRAYAPDQSSYWIEKTYVDDSAKRLEKLY